jgi:hypothetical protein
MNIAQQPSARHAQLRGSLNTAWQSVRVSHSASVVTSAHGFGGPASIGGHTIPVQTPGVHMPVPGVQPEHHI